MIIISIKYFCLVEKIQNRFLFLRLKRVPIADFYLLLLNNNNKFSKYFLCSSSPDFEKCINKNRPCVSEGQLTSRNQYHFFE